ncbi:hypothetical protein [Streptomyces sp. NPDC005125]
MGVSPQAQQFAQFLESVSAKSSTPGLDLAVIRDIVDSNHKASTEPEGVTYAEVDANGAPALWCIPEGADPDRALLHFHYGEYETLADDGAALGHRLAHTKVTSEVHSLPEGQHSFILGAGRVPEVDEAIGQMGQGLRQHLGA